jgi:hypothetical protein
MRENYFDIVFRLCRTMHWLPRMKFKMFIISKSVWSRRNHGNHKPAAYYKLQWSNHFNIRNAKCRFFSALSPNTGDSDDAGGQSNTDRRGPQQAWHLLHHAWTLRYPTIAGKSVSCQLSLAPQNVHCDCVICGRTRVGWIPVGLVCGH